MNIKIGFGMRNFGSRTPPEVSKGALPEARCPKARADVFGFVSTIFWILVGVYFVGIVEGIDGKANDWG